MADGAAAGGREGSGGEVAIVSVSIDLGAGRRGVDMGPSALRIAGLGERLEDLGYELREVGTVNASGPEVIAAGERRAKFLPEITGVARRTHDLVRGVLDEGCLPLILGGDHSLSVGSTAAVAGHYRDRGESLGVIWIDAHTDMNTPESTPSGNIHGMALAILTGRGPDELVRLGGHVPAVDPSRVCVVGARSIDGSEREVVREAGLRVFTMTEVDERGMARCMDEAMERAGEGTAGYLLSFDLDVLDPLVAPGVGTPVAGGITYREAHLACEKVARSGRMVAMEMVELNPVLDLENRTARLAVGLVSSALGKTIL